MSEFAPLCAGVNPKPVVTCEDEIPPEYVPVTSSFSLPVAGFDGVTIRPTLFAVLVIKFSAD
jgi:hypothetical protein